MSTPEGPAGPLDPLPGPRGPLSESNPSGLPDGGISEAWRKFLETVGRSVPDQLNGSKRGRIQLRRLGRRHL